MYLIDYGFALPAPSARTTEPTLFCGTPDYASERAMLASAPYGCRDDLEAFVYTLFDFALCGALAALHRFLLHAAEPACTHADAAMYDAAV